MQSVHERASELLAGEHHGAKLRPGASRPAQYPFKQMRLAGAMRPGKQHKRKNLVPVALGNLAGGVDRGGI